MGKGLLGAVFSVTLFVGCVSDKWNIPRLPILWAGYIGRNEDMYVVHLKSDTRICFERLVVTDLYQKETFAYDDYNDDGVVDKVYRGRGLKSYVIYDGNNKTEFGNGFEMRGNIMGDFSETFREIKKKIERNKYKKNNKKYSHRR
jgi:hypothetical protein